MSISADIWYPGTEINPSATIILFKESDELDFQRIFQDNPQKPIAYSLSPAGEAWRFIINAYIGAKLYPRTPWCPKLFPSNNTLERGIFYNATKISLGLRDINSQLVIEACDELDSILNYIKTINELYIPVNTSRLIIFLRDLASECIKKLESSSPIFHNSHCEKRKSWWTAQIPLSQDFAKIRRQMKSTFGGAIPKNLIKLDTQLAALENKLQKLQASPPGLKTISKSIMEASAYCSAIAERHFKRNNTNGAILLLHRSVDLLLFYICAKFNIIDFTKYGGRYKLTYAPQNSDLIHLLSSLDILTSHSLISPESGRQSDFEDLNKWRNMLMETHYMTSPQDESIWSLFQRIRMHSEKLGEADWRSTRDLYLNGIEISSVEILDPDDIIPNTIKIF